MRFAALILALTFAGTPFAECREADSAHWKRITSVLEKDGSADALVAAALVHRVPLGNAPRALGNLDLAQLAAPQDPDIAWLALSVCADVKGCDGAKRSALLKQLDPANAASYYRDLELARAKDDGAAEDQALAAMAAAQRFDIYWSRLIVRSVDAQRPHRDISLAATETVGWLAAIAIPPFKPTSDTCKEDRLQRPDVVAWCRKLAYVFDNGDTNIAAMSGRHIALRAWKADDARTAWFNERHRQYMYVSETLGPVDGLQDGPLSAQQWVDRFRQNRREQDVMRQWLVDLGIPPDAPADWSHKPPAE